MTITKLDNIFNLIAQAMPELKFYHMGFLLDINDSDLDNHQNHTVTILTIGIHVDGVDDDDLELNTI